MSNCKIFRNNDGSINRVFDELGNESQLYYDTLFHVSTLVDNMPMTPPIKHYLNKGDIMDTSIPEVALGLWAYSYSDHFRNKYNITKSKLEEVSIDDIIRHIEEYYPKSVVQETTTVEQLVIKEGVEDLFNTNPELANQVYEALGFNKNPEFFKGNILNIDDKIYNISEKISSKNLAKRYGFKISSNIPVYIVKENLGVRKGGYDTNQNIIILSENSDKETIEHELIHSVEYNLDKKELNSLYEKVKNKITEDSFKDYVSWNFKKSISEFIADGISKKVFRDALEKEGLLDEVDSALAIYKTDVTPQQKQQALQLYSQYLDTIFPDSKVEEIDNNLYISVLNDLKSQKIIDKQCS